MNATENTLEVANTIRDQIGSRALFMMGALNLTGGENSLSFKIRGCREVSHIRIVLNALDLYTITFLKIRGTNVRKVNESENVYAEDMNRVIASQTGLALSL